MKNTSRETSASEDFPEAEKEKAIQELIYGYGNVFSHYLLSKGESFAETGQQKEDFINLLKRTIEVIPMENEEEKEPLQTLVNAITDPESLSYSDLATKLDLLGSTIETPLYKLSRLAYKEMEKNDPEVSRKYIKTIL